jgi:hypothetical protein
VQQALAGVLLRGRFADGVEQPGLDFVALVEVCARERLAFFRSMTWPLSSWRRTTTRFLGLLFALASDLREFGIAHRALGQLKAGPSPDGLKLLHVPCMMTFAPALAA